MLSLFLNLLIFPINAETNDRPQNRRIEPTPVVVTLDGQEYFAYDFEKAKELLKLIEDYHALWGYTLDLENEIQAYKTKEELLLKKVVIWKDLSEQQYQQNELYLSWLKNTQLRLNESEKLRIKKDWYWKALVGVETIALGVIGTIALVK